MTPGQRIKKARIAAGLSQQALADAISQFGDGNTVSRTAIAQWESEVTKQIEAANLLKTAKILNVAPEWLQFGVSTTNVVFTHQDGLVPAVSNTRTIPILSNAQLVNYREENMELEHNALSNIGIDSELANVIGPHACAFSIKGNSMSPAFKSGDLVIIDPDTKPLPGEIVAAKLQNEETIVLRKYRPLGKDLTGFDAFELIPFNEDWPKIVINSKNPATIIGTLVEHRCRRRLHAHESHAKKHDTSPA